MIHIVKGVSVVSEAEVDIFLESPFFFYDPVDVDNFISGSSALSKPCLYTWKFSVHILLKPSLKDFEHYLASMRSETIIQWFEQSLVLPFFGLEMKAELFKSRGHCCRSESFLNAACSLFSTCLFLCLKQLMLSWLISNYFQELTLNECLSLSILSCLTLCVKTCFGPTILPLDSY